MACCAALLHNPPRLFLAEPTIGLDGEGAQVTGHDSSQATYIFERSIISASELISQISASYRFRDLEVREPDIEETVQRIYEEKLLG